MDRRAAKDPDENKSSGQLRWRTNSIDMLELQCSQQPLPGFSRCSCHMKIKKFLLLPIVIFQWLALNGTKNNYPISDRDHLLSRHEMGNINKCFLFCVSRKKRKNVVKKNCQKRKKKKNLPKTEKLPKAIRKCVVVNGHNPWRIINRIKLKSSNYTILVYTVTSPKIFWGWLYSIYLNGKNYDSQSKKGKRKRKKTG